MRVFGNRVRWLRNLFAAEAPEPEVVARAEAGAAGDPLLRVRVERWSDGSVYIMGEGSSLEFGNLGRDDLADAKLWLERATRLVDLVGEEES